MSRPDIVSERQRLCIEMAALKERLFRVGLYKTAHLMDAACRAIGYEVAAFDVALLEAKRALTPKDDGA